ncbi:MAG: DUF1934 domain-containing protein [Lachnospiraceae bacterium]|nr:DUF1934 domain-containing protein [Lachnospiraceae bacterium]
MNRDVKLNIVGIQMGASGTDRIETAAEAQYYDKGGSRFVIYEEQGEGFEEPIKSRIKFKKNYLEISRQGNVSTHMVFEEGRKNMAEYGMPYGTVLLGTDTHSMELSESGERIVIKISYSLEINGSHQSDNCIEIKIENR